jgi:hypothetical protein
MSTLRTTRVRPSRASRNENFDEITVARENKEMALDMDKLNVFVGQFVGDLGAAVHSGMVVIGEKLGLYKLSRKAR